MKVEDSTIAFIKLHEGVKYKMYIDSAGKPTIGCGHLILPKEGYLLSATLNDEQVNDLLRMDIIVAANAVNLGVEVTINQNQWDALVAFAFNVGANGFLYSTLLKVINIFAPKDEITDAFMMWNKITIKGKKVISKGLINRRQAEIDLY